MKKPNQEIEFAIEVFVRGHSAGRSRTFPYEVSRVGPIWLMRDATRKNPRNYRKEEWIAHDVEPGEVDAVARGHTRGRFFACVINRGRRAGRAHTNRIQGSRLSVARDGGLLCATAETDSQAAASRLHRTRSHTRLGRTFGESHSHSADPKQFARRRRSIPPVRGTRSRGRRWARAQCGRGGSYVVCGHVCQPFASASRHRASAAVNMLRDDRARGSKCSVLTASHTGA